MNSSLSKNITFWHKTLSRVWLNLVTQPSDAELGYSACLASHQLGPQGSHLRSRAAQPQRAQSVPERRLGGWRSPRPAALLSPESVTASQRCTAELLLQRFSPSVLGNILTSTKPSFPERISFLETSLHKNTKKRKQSLFLLFLTHVFV